MTEFCHVNRAQERNSFQTKSTRITGVKQLSFSYPVDFENKEPEEVVTKRTIDGASGILKACLNSIEFHESGVDIMDEGFWSDVDYIKS